MAFLRDSTCINTSAWRCWKWGNIGIGGALNKGFAFLKNLKPEFVVTFDQDSLAAKGQIAKLVQAWDAASERGKRKGAIGPAFYDLRKGVAFEYPFFAPMA